MLPGLQRLGRLDVETQLRRLQSELPPKDFERLQTLARGVEDGRIGLVEALGIFAGQDREAALTSLRQLRKRLREAAKAAGVDLELVVEPGTRTPPERRHAWFTGPSLAEGRAADLSSLATAADPSLVPPRALALGGGVAEAPVTVFVSYADADAPEKDDLLRRLAQQLRMRTRRRFEFWHFRQMLPGADTDPEIQAAIERCDLGLLLLSPTYFSRSYICDREIPHFVGPAAKHPAVPLGLAKVPLGEKAQLCGIESKWVFLSPGGRFFAPSNKHLRDEFAGELAERLLDVAAKRLTPPTLDAPPVVEVEIEAELEAEPVDELTQRVECFLPSASNVLFEPARGRLASLEASRSETEAPALDGQEVDAVEHLLAWAGDPASPPFYALLGEYGMGKTTTCQIFTQRLLAARKRNPALPVPVYLDLRRLGDLAKENPRLEAILEEVVGRTWQAGATTTGALTPGEIVELARTGRAVVIFDGLDEVLVHLSPSGGQKFTRELWRILPPPGRPAESEPAGAGARGKLVISCRTHYFRSLREERGHFTGEGREPVTGGDYQALVLLPFTPEQIERYLTNHLPGADIEQVLALLRSVHNLTEMATRPYTLKLITDHLPALERLKASGRPVYGVSLYREMVQAWLARDGGKHQLVPEHKELLMEHFAAELWRSGRRTWRVGDVEQWLVDFLCGNESVAAHYDGKDRALLKEDLRTATFLVRDGEEDFRFAHTSLQEYFLATHLARALAERRFAAWEMAVPSAETLDFLGQLLAERQTDDGAGVAALKEIRGEYRPRTSELALAYALRAVAKGWPAPALARWQLPGAELRGWEFRGAEAEGAPLLDLSSANFSGARLRDARFQGVRLDDANFAGADLTTAEFLTGRARGASFERARLVGTLFRLVELGGASWRGAKQHRTKWLRCDGLSLDVPSRLEGFVVPSSLALSEAGLNHLLFAGGHRGLVVSCAFDTMGRRLVSAGSDGTVRLWDAATGEPERVFEGHRGTVRSCGFDASSRRVVSAGDDGTVRLWDVETGEPERLLEGNQGIISSCGFDPTGRRVVAAGSNGTMRLWNAATGEPERVLKSHQAVVSCRFDASGRRVVSAGSNGTVRLWDAATGEPDRLLEGHRGFVWSCGFDATGRRVVSAGSDGTVRLWDAASGEPECILEGHQGIILSCGFDPTGHRVVSAGSDGTVRLWDAATGDPERVFESHQGFVLSCGFDPTGHRVVSADPNGTVRLWDTVTGEPERLLEGHRGAVRSCGFDASGRRVVSAGSDDTVRLWDAATGKPERVLEGHRGGALSCGFDASGRRVVSAGSDGTVRLWDTASGEPERVLEGHRGSVRSCGFDASGRRVVSAGDDGTVRLWDAATGKPEHVLKGHQGGVWSCGFDASGRRVVSAGPDGTVRLWNAVSGKPERVLEGHQGGAWSCGFDATGRHVLSAGDDGTVRLWDAVSGEPKRVLEGHRGVVRSCGFDSSGRRVVSAGDDGTVRLWNVETGCESGFRFLVLEDRGFAVFDAESGALRSASPDAWRYLRWPIPDPETGEVVLWPAETFGPLPGVGGKAVS